MREIGCTVGERIRQRRIERASQLLGHGLSLVAARFVQAFAFPSLRRGAGLRFERLPARADVLED